MSEAERTEQSRVERHAQILDLLARQESASIEGLRAVSGASVATLRRDLEALERDGVIRRYRGGARLARRPSSLDEAFTSRRRRNARAKSAIATTAAGLVRTEASLFINDGSTALALAETLAARGERAWVATSALNIAERLASTGTIEVVVLGGTLRGSSFGTIGPLATATLAELSADVAFLGCDGFDPEGGVRSNTLMDAEIARAMAAGARRVVVIADASKLHNAARARIVGWDAVDDLITDAGGPELERALRQAGVRHVRVQP